MTCQRRAEKGSLGELFTSVRLMIYYVRMEFEFFASGQSNIPEPNPGVDY